MLEKFRIQQFGGLQTVTDSNNIGVTSARECKNFLLRPLGALSVPAAWTAFSPGGTALDLGFLTTIDLLFDTGIRLLLQSPDLQWWNATPEDDGTLSNTVVSYSGSTISSDQAVSASTVLAFKKGSSLNWQLGADSAIDNYFTIKLGFVPYAGTTYSADRAFVTGVGPVFTDGGGQQFRLTADNASGVYALRIA